MKASRQVRHRLITSSGHAFQTLVGELLADLLDRSAESKTLGSLDRGGVDAYVYGVDVASLEIVIQCKGFEFTNYDKNQHSQCQAEIDKFLRKGPSNIQEYWLVVNRPIKEKELRSDLLCRLHKLVETGTAQKALLLDLDHFVKKLAELASKRLVEWAEARRAELYEYYAERMEVVDHIDGVPFLRPSETDDPVNCMLGEIQRFFAELPPDQTGKYRAPPRFLVTSGFGFGKTSSLYQLGKKWVQEGGNLVFVPAPLLSDRAFANTAGLADALLPFLTPDDFEPIQDIRLLLRDALRHNLSSSTDWIILIDALDESPWAYNTRSLGALWGSIIDIGVPAVLTAREELFGSRPAEFELDPVRKKVTFTQLELLDWPNNLILEFVDKFSSRRGGAPGKDFVELRNLIAEGKYVDVYGDIPRRPLFLRMLCEDAWTGRQPARQLHRLYGRYFRQKLKLDRHSTSARGAVTRPSDIVDTFGEEEAAERLIGIMEEVAAFMFGPPFVKQDEYQGRPSLEQDAVEEDVLKEVASSQGVEFALFEDLLMHSLLQPGGRDRATRKRLVRFAHRSYQDWFLARRIARGDKGASVDCSNAVTRFVDSMRLDLDQGVGLP